MIVNLDHVYLPVRKKNNELLFVESSVESALRPGSSSEIHAR